jgi:hypothetical protein
MEKLIREVHGSRRKIYCLLAVLVIGSSLIAYATAHIYWTRTIEYDLGEVVGIEALLIDPTGESWHNKVQASTLNGQKKIGLTVLKENFHEIWLNLTFTSNASGLVVSASGQYYNCVKHTGAAYYDANPVGSSFNIPMFTAYTVDKTKMLYVLDDTGGYLQITYAFDTELVTSPGHYTANLSFEMGFV